MSDPTNRAGYGPIEGPLTFWSSAALTTTALQVTIARGGAGATRAFAVKVKIKNGHATNFLAWDIVARPLSGFAAPTMTADFVNATCKSVIGPGETEIFSSTLLAHAVDNGSGVLVGLFDLVVVGSAASTTVNVTTSLVQL
jgi:hypothetical protein